jgi:hypothetical protein
VAYATWCDDSLNPIDVPNLPQGFSYLLATADIVQVQNSGEVKDAAVTISADAGFASAGNGTPTDRMLSSLSFAGGIDNFDSIQFLDSNANVQNVYTWLTPDVQNPDTAVAYATWCDDGLNPVTGIAVPAASGFLLETAAGCTMTIPSPFAP